MTGVHIIHINNMEFLQGAVFCWLYKEQRPHVASWILLGYLWYVTLSYWIIVLACVRGSILPRMS